MDSPFKGQIGLDACAEIFESDAIHLSLETDAFPFAARKQTITRFDELSRKIGFRRTETQVNGRKAVIVTYEDPKAEEGFRHQAALSIAAKGGFRMFISMKKSDDESVSEMIFRSVRFIGGNL